MNCYDQDHSKQDPHNQWKRQSNRYVYLKQDPHDQSRCIHYNMKTHYGEQHLDLYIIGYCFRSINSSFCNELYSNQVQPRRKVGPTNDKLNYNMKSYYGEQHLDLYIINYCFGNINSSTYDNMLVCTYRYGEQRLLFNTDISTK